MRKGWEKEIAKAQQVTHYLIGTESLGRVPYGQAIGCDCPA